MRFQTNSSEWIAEVKSYLTDSTKKLGEIKRCLKSVDFSKISYEDKFRLSKLFDPTAEITGEAFKRQLDLYFSLLESKSAPISIPVFSEYVEWIYSQDPKQIPDKMFDLMTSRLAKSTATEIPETVSSFMTNLTQEYSRDIDKLTNARLGTLVSILKDIGTDYDSMPEECKVFVRNMFVACAVKTEIADRNKKEFRGLFKDDPRTYYNWFNKAFAGYGSFETWIDEPAKKLNLKNMINYANMQDMVVETDIRNLNFSKFQSYARILGLPRLPEYEGNGLSYRANYLQEPREYKDYAKKLADIFVQMVRSEVFGVAQKASATNLTNADMFALAPTKKMGRRIDSIRNSSSVEDLSLRYASYLVDLVHLDELTGQHARDIFNPSYLSGLQPQVEPEPAVQMTLEQASLQASQMTPEQAAALAEQLSEEDYGKSDLEQRLQKELNELYEEYHELAEQGKKDYNIESRIVDIEAQLRELA